jgi:hypothetical protein
MPRRFFEADLASIEPDIDAVSELATIYEASLHATALRTVQLSTRPVLLVVLEPGVRKAERQQLGAMPRLRVTGSSSNGYFPFIPRNKSATEEGALVKALAGEDVETTASLLELGIPSDSFRVSARSVPYTDQRGECHQRVIAIFWQPSAA